MSANFISRRCKLRCDRIVVCAIVGKSMYTRSSRLCLFFAHPSLFSSLIHRSCRFFTIFFLFPLHFAIHCATFLSTFSVLCHFASLATTWKNIPLQCPFFYITFLLLKFYRNIFPYFAWNLSFLILRPVFAVLSIFLYRIVSAKQYPVLSVARFTFFHFSFKFSSTFFHFIHFFAYTHTHVHQFRATPCTTLYHLSPAGLLCFIAQSTIPNPPTRRSRFHSRPSTLRRLPNVSHIPFSLPLTLPRCTSSTSVRRHPHQMNESAGPKASVESSSGTVQTSSVAPFGRGVHVPSQACNTSVVSSSIRAEKHTKRGKGNGEQEREGVRQVDRTRSMFPLGEACHDRKVDP